MRRLVNAYAPSRDCWEDSAEKMVLRRDEISSVVGGTPEGPFATTVGMAVSGNTVCGIVQIMRGSRGELRYQRYRGGGSEGGLGVRGETPAAQRAIRAQLAHTQRIEDQVESQVLYKTILRHPEDPNTRKKKKKITRRGESEE
jgi:hypothetical protein